MFWVGRGGGGGHGMAWDLLEGEGNYDGNFGAATERLQGTVKAVGVRLMAVTNAVEAGVGMWECLWGRVRARVLGGRGYPSPRQAIAGGGAAASSNLSKAVSEGARRKQQCVTVPCLEKWLRASTMRHHSMPLSEPLAGALGARLRETSSVFRRLRPHCLSASRTWLSRIGNTLCSRAVVYKPASPNDFCGLSCQERTSTAANQI